MKGLAVYIGLAQGTERTLAAGLREVARGHAAEGEIPDVALVLAAWSDQHARMLAPLAARYGEEPDAEPERLQAAELPRTRGGPVGLLRDLQDLHLTASLAGTTWAVLRQAAKGAHDEELTSVSTRCEHENARQVAWLKTHIESIAPQALLAAAPG